MKMRSIKCGLAVISVFFFSAGFVSANDEYENLTLAEILALETRLNQQLGAVKARKLELARAANGIEPVEADSGANNASGEKDKTKLFDQIQVRQSIYNKPGNDEAALFQFTESGSAGAEDSFLADVGVYVLRDVNLYRDWTSQYGVFAEFHRNDAGGDNETDTHIIGLNIFTYAGEDTGSAQQLEAKLAYKSDDLVSGQGLIASFNWYPVCPYLKMGDFFIKNDYIAGRYVPYISLEYEEGDGEITRFPDGKRTSFVAGVSLNAELFPKALYNRLETNFSYTYWEHFSRSGGYDDFGNDQTFLTASATFWLDKITDEEAGALEKGDKHIGLKTEFTKGDNPNSGKFDNDLWTVGFAVKY